MKLSTFPGRPPRSPYSCLVCATILIAEDDRHQAELLRRYLMAEGHEVLLAPDGQTTLDIARSRHLELIVLDLMMPRLDGLTACRVLREESSVLILMLTARSSEEDMLLGLDIGADDYLSKPYSPREVVTRIRALLRRAPSRSSPADRPLQVGPLTIDLHEHTVTKRDQSVECTPAQFAILAAMAAQPNRVFTRPQLLEHTRGVDRDSTNRAIDMQVMQLRRKIEPDPRRPRYLVTVYGVGYKLTDGTR
jgi:two-component system response regulator MtrA